MIVKCAGGPESANDLARRYRLERVSPIPDHESTLDRLQPLLCPKGGHSELAFYVVRRVWLSGAAHRASKASHSHVQGD